MRAEVKLKTDEFELLRRYVNRRAGLNVESSAMPVFEQRLNERLTALGLESFRDYHRLLHFGGDGEPEADEALSLLTTGETYFFRNSEQLLALQQQILPELERQNRDSRRLRIWSAGCSTGEEVYTLAIMISESGLFDGWDVRIIGADLCKSRIQSARRARYQEGAFRTTERRLRQRYFVQAGAEWEVSDGIKALCEFLPLNLCDTGEAALVGRVHAVLCRNVLIYLDDRARERVLTNLYDRLLPGGFLLIGHSESLQQHKTGFELVQEVHDTAYRKPGGARPREVSR
ncbi:MAG: protein-glutamate O-methyltransferase CheR [Polyangiaceae bacterium]